MEKIGIDGRIIPTSGQFKSFDNGGKGSGNFGHAGRPGEVGGSAPAGNGQSKTDPEEKKEIKGGTKAEHEAIMEMVKSYAVDERGIDGVYEDVEAAAHPHEDHTTFQKAKRWLEAGGGEVSYDGAYKTLKDLYGDSFKPETYLTKGGNEENGDWKYKDGQPYVWSTYLYKFAKAIADEMDKRKRGNSLEGTVVNAVIEALNGGKGSGNFGHAGRPGEVGGSASMGSVASSSKKPSQGAELYKKIGESQKRAEKQEAIVKGFEKAAKAMDKLEKAFKKAKAGGSKADLTELVYDAQERVTDLYFLDDMKKADQKDRADYDKKQRELAVEIYKFTTGKEPKKMPPSRDEDIHFWGY